MCDVCKGMYIHKNHPPLSEWTRILGDINSYEVAWGRGGRGSGAVVDIPHTYIIMISLGVGEGIFRFAHTSLSLSYEILDSMWFEEDVGDD